MILITGADGRNGAAIARHLLTHNLTVRAMVRDEDGADGLRKAVGEAGSIETAIADFDDASSLVEAMHGCDVVVLLLPFTSEMTVRHDTLIAAARTAGSIHLIKFSEAASDPNSTARFLRAHGEGAVKIADSGLPYTNLRFNDLMQNLLLQQGIAERSQLWNPIGKGRVGWIDLEDAAEVVAQVASQPQRHAGLTYDVTGGELLGYRDLQRVFGDVLGRDITLHDVSSREEAEHTGSLGDDPWQREGVFEIYEHVSRGAGAYRTAAVASLTAREPRTFAAFVAEHRGAFGG